MAAAQDPVPPCWIKDPLSNRQGPKSWVVYIVSKITDRHRPLAVFSLQELDVDSMEYDEVISVCRHTVAVFSDPTNRVALASELSLATGFYQDPQNASLPVCELPTLDYLGSMNRAPADVLEHQILPEFPFISSCLGVVVEGLSGQGDEPHRIPLGTVFRDENPSYGMLVFDISCLEEVRYGIVAFSAQPMVFISTHEQWRNWVVMGQELDGSKEMRVEDERLRIALSAKTFAEKFAYRDCDDIAPLERVPLVEPAAFEIIWPSNTSSLNNNPPLKARRSIRSLRDTTIMKLIESTLETDRFDMSLFDEPRKLPSFQPSLQRLLEESPEHIGQSHSAAQLIALAFEGKTHLNLTRCKGLAADTIRVALEMDELKQVESLSICIDYILGTPSQLIEVIRSFPTLCELYLLQSPTRESDQPSIDFCLELFKDSHPTPYKVVISGIHSTALRKQSWLPASGFNLPTSSFPVHHLFHRLESVTPRPRRWWRTERYYVGDGFLTPRRFVAGFLRWIDNPSFKLIPFAVASPDLGDMSRVEVTPIPAENFSTRLQRKPPRGLVRGSWCALVSIAKHSGSETRERNGQRARGARYVQYALVRLLVDVAAKDLPVELKSEEIEVRGLKEFLDDTTEEGVDGALVNERLAELGDKIAGWPFQGTLGDGLERISVMSHQEGHEALNHFINRTFFKVTGS